MRVLGFSQSGALLFSRSVDLSDTVAFSHALTDVSGGFLAAGTVISGHGKGSAFWLRVSDRGFALDSGLLEAEDGHVLNVADLIADGPGDWVLALTNIEMKIGVSSDLVRLTVRSRVSPTCRTTQRLAGWEVPAALPAHQMVQMGLAE
jgi:hypothetical protein